MGSREGCKKFAPFSRVSTLGGEGVSKYQIETKLFYDLFFLLEYSRNGLKWLKNIRQKFIENPITLLNEGVVGGLSVKTLLKGTIFLQPSLTM